MTLMSIVIGALGTITKRLRQGLEDLEIRGRVETTQTIALLIEIDQNTEKSPGVLEVTYSHSNSSEKPSANFYVKNS